MTMMMMMMMSGGGSETLWEACGCMVHRCGECHFSFASFPFLYMYFYFCLYLYHNSPLCGKCPTFPFAFFSFLSDPSFLSYNDHHVIIWWSSLVWWVPKILYFLFFLSVKLSYSAFFFHFLFFIFGGPVSFCYGNIVLISGGGFWYSSIICKIHPTPRIPNSCCSCCCSVTKSVKWQYLGNQAWYHRSAGVKTTGKNSK